MKNLDIFYFGNVNAVNGVNFVTDLLISGKDGFERNGIRLKNLFALNGRIDLQKTSNLAIGQNKSGKSDRVKQVLKRTFSNILTSKISFFAWIKIKKSMIDPAEHVVNNYGQEASEFIIFQDIFTAYFFLKRYKNHKTLLILHCSENPFEQVLGYYPAIRSTRYESKLDMIQEYVYNNINKVVFLSSAAHEYNVHLLGRKSSFIYNGIPDINKVEREKIVKERSILNLVCVGSINGRKGQDLLIHSLNSLDISFKQRIHLHLVGGGRDFDSLKELIVKFKLTDNVTMHGVRNDVDVVLKDMDIMALPSSSEGMPLSLLEGMRQGMYIMATPIGAIPEMIDNSFGDLIERNVESIVNKLKLLIEDPNKIEVAKNASRQFYLDNFTQDCMVAKYAELINEMNEKE